MKIYKIIGILAAGSLMPVMTSCYDLDRTPGYQVSSEAFFLTEEHCKQAMMAVYHIMHSEDAFGMMPQFDGLGPICNLANGGSFNFRNILTNNYSANTGDIKSRWQVYYEGVARSNNVIQNVDRADMTDELKLRYKAEARFFRGLFYFSLLDLWGGVPIYDDTFDVGSNYMNMLYPRSSAEEVREFVLKDLGFAADVLPDKWDEANYGRVTSGAAMSLKGKVLLYGKRYKEAAECFQTVIDSHLYELYPDYAALFTPEGHSSSEMIFAIQNLGGLGQDIGIPLATYLGSRSTYTLNGTGCFNRVLPSNAIVAEYEWADGRPFDWEEFIPGFNTNYTGASGNPWPTRQATFLATLASDKKSVKKYPKDKDKLVKMWNERDPRLNANVILPYMHYTGWYKQQPVDLEFVVCKKIQDGNGMIRLDKDRLCYLWRKFVPTGDMGGLIHEAGHTPINFPLIRYADVLLMQAECLNELGRQDDAVKLINQVRSRPSVNMPGINSGPDYLAAAGRDEVFKRIRHERLCELACEGHSFSDYRRWGVLEELDGVEEGHMTGDYLFSTRVITPRQYLWPIPLTEIDRNPALEQNPGY